VQAEHLDAGRVLLLARQDHAAFAGNDVLGHVEREAAEVADRADVLAVVLRLDGVRAVLDDLELVLPRQRHQLVHFAGPPREVNRHDGTRALAQLGSHLNRIDVQRAGVDVGQHRRRPGVNDGVDRCAKGQRRGDDFVARPDAGGQQGKMKCSGAGVQRHGMRRTAVDAEIMLELRDPRTCAEPARAHDGLDLLNLVFLDLRRTEDQEIVFASYRHRVPQLHAQMLL
jgi:hypothetical protein